MSNLQSIKKLSEAFKNKNLSLFLGAGVSVPNNLPSWDKLVLAMYFSTISEQEMGGWRPFSNYLYAIAEWYLSNGQEPLEITARKLRKYYEKDSDGSEKFMDTLFRTLYGSFLDDRGSCRPTANKEFIRQKNSTLNVVAKLCESTGKGVKSVVTYNYDNLLQIALDNFPHQSIYTSQMSLDDSLPIYHVHGFIPLDNSLPRSEVNEIVFTEDQYHVVSNDSYHWSNIVQLQAISNSVGLMIGLSLSDRNIRRLFDAAKHAPIRFNTYAILKEPDTTLPTTEEIDTIHKKAIAYYQQFQNENSDSNESEVFFRSPGLKSERIAVKSSVAGTKGPSYQNEIAGIIGEVKRLAKEQQEYVLKQLGIEPIWINEFSEIPGIINKILES